MRTLLCRQLAPAALFLLALCAADACCAQGGVPRRYGGRYYPPYDPTMSPYPNYFRRGSDLFDPYNTFIGPRRPLQDRLGEIVQEERLQNVRLESQIQGIRAATAAPTGTGATFMNYSHYYGGQSGGAAARGR